MFIKSILKVGLLLKPKSCFLSKTFNFKEYFSSDEIEKMLSYIDLDGSYDAARDVGSALKDAGYSQQVWQRICKNLQTYKILDFDYEWDGLAQSYGKALDHFLEKACKKGYKPPAKIQDQLEQAKFKKALDRGFPLIHWSELNVMKPRNYLVKGLIDRGAITDMFKGPLTWKGFGPSFSKIMSQVV